MALSSVRIRACGVIVRNEKLLLAEFYDEAAGWHFNVPGGGVEDGETVIEAVQREVREETVLLVTVGRLLLVAVDGNGQRCGMSLDELAATMIKLGARDAMNLDGGGSTTFVADGRLINGPSDGSERRVSNAVLIFVTDRVAADGG